jgi:putative Mg2+ transporter-C (MgtC) family protein
MTSGANSNKADCGTFAAGHRWVHSTPDLRQRSMLSVKSNSNSSDGDHTDKIHNKFHKPYFTEFTARKAILYIVASVYVIGCGLASMAELLLELPCDKSKSKSDPDLKFPNPAYDGSHCPYIRHPILLGMNRTECSFGRRLVMSIIMGGLIGWERRQADRPAGIRTMSLVSLGSCLFTINSAYAFMNGPMAWDASRISAAIPSGVGFLGAGLIFKKTEEDSGSMVVHGLTTAASVWLSAAVRISDYCSILLLCFYFSFVFYHLLLYCISPSCMYVVCTNFFLFCSF